MARDVFSILSTSVGVERMFNYARDICHYRRNNLNDTTIQDLMIYMCLSRFNNEKERLAFIRDSLMSDEDTEEDGEQADELSDGELDPISDTEEDISVQP